MTVPKDEATWTYLNRFIGYGSRHPRFVFLGLEERAHPGNERENIDKRLGHTQIFGGSRGDKNAAHALLYPTTDAERVPQWAIAAGLVKEIRRALGEDASGTTVGSLGTTDGDTFLGELLPVPRPGRPRGKKNGQRSTRPPSYPVSRFGFRGETAYHRAALGRNPAGHENRDGTAETGRWQALCELVARTDGQQRPEFVICYGVTWRAVFDQLLGPWRTAEEDSSGGSRVWKIGLSKHGVIGAITGFFTARARPNSREVTLTDCAAIAKQLCEVHRRGQAILSGS